jgi:hypothetical protein
MSVFHDEMGPADAANRGAGLLAPMYRHWIEFAIVIWIAFIETTVGPYYFFGRATGVHINWHADSAFAFMRRAE